MALIFNEGKVEESVAWLFEGSEEELNVLLEKLEKNVLYPDISDLIFWDEDNVYLMCNKGIFNGEHIRDLQNQIYTSSKMLQSIKINDKARITEYYEKLDDNEKSKIGKEEFIKLFDKNIYFIAGFLEDFKSNTKSPYAKYVIVDLNKKLNSLNYKLIILNYGE